MEIERKENGNCRFEGFFVKSKKSDPDSYRGKQRSCEYLL